MTETASMRDRAKHTTPRGTSAARRGRASMAGLLLALLTAPAGARAGEPVAPGEGWAEKAGRIVINQAPLRSDLAQAEATYLTGYLWGPSLGWILLGNGPGDGVRYSNSSGADFGINVEVNGTLTGYAWSEKFGWIEFGPGPGAFVTVSGELRGMAWSRAAGWITFGTPYSRESQELPMEMTRLGEVLELYGDGAIDVVSDSMAGLCLRIAGNQDLKRIATNLVLDSIASGALAQIARELFREGLTSVTRAWIVEHVQKVIVAPLLEAGEQWVLHFATDEMDGIEEINRDWEEPEVAAFLRQYLHDRLDSRLRLFQDQLRAARDAVPAAIPGSVPADEIIGQLRQIRTRVARVIPSGTEVREDAVVWAVRGMCSFGELGNQDPKLFGAISSAARATRMARDTIGIIDTVTQIRRWVCVGWVGGGGVIKVVAHILSLSGTPIGAAILAAPIEAVYWGGVTGCKVASQANTPVNLLADAWAIVSIPRLLGSLIGDIESTVAFERGLLAEVIHALAAPGSCSPELLVGELNVDDVHVLPFAAYGYGTATVEVTNNGVSSALVRGWLEIYQEQGGSYAHLAAPPAVASEGDVVLAPGESETLTFDFLVPAGNLVFSKDYKAQCVLVGSAGVHTRSNQFTACQPLACLVDAVGRALAGGGIQQGEEQDHEVRTDEAAVETEFVLMYQGSDLDLHLFDRNGGHVGLDYESGEVEVTIPGATYGGADQKIERITVPGGSAEDYTVRVVARETSGLEDYTVLVRGVPAQPALLAASPSAMQVELPVAGGAALGLTIGEAGGQAPIENLLATLSPLASDTSSLPEGAMRVEGVPMGLEPGQTAGVTVTVSVPPTQPLGTYRGTLDFTWDGGETTVEVSVRVSPGFEPFRRGDSNGDGYRDISDAVYTLLALFRGAGPILCEDSADTNDDGAVNLSDARYALDFMFRGRPVPPAPYASCGDDPTPDPLTCDLYLPCE